MGGGDSRASTEKSDAELKKEHLSCRLGYCAFLLVGSVCALILGLVDPRQWYYKIPFVSHSCPSGMSSDDCVKQNQALAVLRFSFAMTLFFALHGLALSGPRAKKDSWRYILQYNFWFIKGIVFLLFLLAAFAIHPSFYYAYDDVARIGAGFFLLMQIIILIDMSYNWNKEWVSRDGTLWPYAAVGTGGLGVIGSFVCSGLFFRFYSKPDCELTNFFIGFAIALLVVLLVLTLMVGCALSCSHCAPNPSTG